MLGGILGLALLHNSGNALGVTIPAAESATLAWDSSSTADVAGYRVYFGAVSGNYTSSVEAGNATTNTVPGLVSGAVYFFAVKAYDANGLESAFSNEISFVPGLPSLQLAVSANGQAVLTLKGQVGHAYDIQATPDLQIWTGIGNVTVGTGGSVDFTDVNAASFLKRFYRAHDTQP